MGVCWCREGASRLFVTSGRVVGFTLLVGVDQVAAKSQRRFMCVHCHVYVCILCACVCCRACADAAVYCQCKLHSKL